MADADDVYVGRALIESGRITRDELIECLFDFALERRAPDARVRPLGILLVARHRISRADLNALLARRTALTDRRLAQASAPALGELLIASGAATRDQIAECLVLQEAETAKRLGELLVERGYSTVAQIERALAYHDKTIYQCTECKGRFNLVGAIPGQPYCCETCGGVLEHAPAGALDAKEEKGTTRRILKPAAKPAPAPAVAEQVPPLAPEAQVQLDRASYVYIKQKLTVRREALREAELLQMELARFDVWIPFIDILQKLGGLTWLQADQVRKTEFDKLIATKAWKEEAVPGYRVVSKIASGSFATIFSADPVFGGKRIALKVLHADRVNDADAVARFRREAALLMRLRHPAIIQAYDLSEHAGAHYLSMELVDGDSLERAVYEGRGLNSVRALNVLRQVTVALKYLHAEGYVHRDVKPANILVAKDGAAKLCDLGLVEESKAGVESDLYSLGVTLFYMLSANARFAGPASSEVLAARFVSAGVEVDPAALRAPGPIVDLLGRLVHRDRAQRVQTYADLLNEITVCGEALRR